MCKGPEAEASLVRQSWEELGDRAQWLVGRSWVSVGMAQRGCVLACYNSCWVCVCFIRLFDLLRGPHQNIMWNLIVKCWPRIQSHSHFTGGQNIPFPTRPDINLGRNPPEIKTYAHRNIYGAILRSRPVGESRSPQMCPSARGCRDVPGAPAQRPAHRERRARCRGEKPASKGTYAGRPRTHRHPPNDGICEMETDARVPGWVMGAIPEPTRGAAGRGHQATADLSWLWGQVCRSPRGAKWPRTLHTHRPSAGSLPLFSSTVMPRPHPFKRLYLCE